MPNSGDILLYTLSAWRETAWPKYKGLFDALYLRVIDRDETLSNNTALQRWQTLRALDALGHCDTNFVDGAGRITISPSLLVRLPLRGLPQVLLCGSRGPQTLDLLESASLRHGCTLHADPQSLISTQAFIPQRIVVEAENTDALENVARDMGLGFAAHPPASSLLRLAPDLDTYLATRSWEPIHAINWETAGFDSDTLQFYPSPERVNDAELVRLVHPLKGTNYYYLRRGQEHTTIDPYWGRYAALRSQGKSILFYDTQKSLLVVPSSTPFPQLLARAVTLCTGYVANSVPKSRLNVQSPENFGFEIFSGISEVIAKEVSAKLGQRLHLTKLSLE